MDRILRDAQRLYDEGKWPEAVKLIGDNVSHLTSEEEMAEAARIRGWSFYYMGIKGLEEKKLEMLGFSRGMFELALGTTTDNKKKISILNGLPLSLWILGEQKEAWQTSDRAIAEFPDEPSVWNTRSILFRWAKDFKGSAEVCEMVYKKALDRGDLRTAGHAKQNRADALKELGRKQEAEVDYVSAIGLYLDFEKRTGQNAKFP